jgi:hypothetical protein
MQNKMIAALVLAAVNASAAGIGFEPGQTLSSREVLDQAAKGAAAVIPEFLAKLGDGTYAGASGSLTLDAEQYAIVESRVIARQKTQDGLPGVTLRLYRRAAKGSNPSHVETVADELTLIAGPNGLFVRRDGRPDAPGRLGKCGENSLSFSYDKAFVRYGPVVVESYALALEGGALSVERTESAGGAVKAREAFSAGR